VSQDDRIDRLHELLNKVRAAAVERGLDLPRDLPPGALAETMRQRRASDPIGSTPPPPPPWPAPPTAPLTAFAQTDVASEPLMLLPTPESTRDGAPGPLEPEPSSVTKMAQIPRQLIEYSGTFDEEETSTGNVDELERIALEEERLARERDEEEIRRSGLLDDEAELVADDELEIVDEEDATTDPPGPTPEALAYAAAALSSSPPDAGRPTMAHDPAFEDVQYEAESVRPEGPADGAGDFERAVASFAARQRQHVAEPLELEDLDGELSRSAAPPAGSVSPAAIDRPPSVPARPAPVEPPRLEPPLRLQPPTHLEPPARLQPPTLLEPPSPMPTPAPLQPPTLLEPPPIFAQPEPPGAFAEPSPATIDEPPPRFEAARFEPPRFEPPRFEPPRFEPPRFKAPESERTSEDRPDLANEAPPTQAMPDVEALETEALQPLRPPLESAPFPIIDEVSAERPRHVSEPPFDVAEEAASAFDEPAEPLLDEAPESSRRPVAFGEPADPELSMGPPESGEVESQPYPRGTIEGAGAQNLGDDDLPPPGEEDDDDGGPATMHRMTFDDGDAPTPKPVQRSVVVAAVAADFPAAPAPAPSLGAVDVVDRLMREPSPDVVVIAPRSHPRATTFGAVLDRALSLLAPPRE
jgi:hypothetical protein